MIKEVSWHPLLGSTYMYRINTQKQKQRNPASKERKKGRKEERKKERKKERERRKEN